MRFFAKIQERIVIDTFVTNSESIEEDGWVEHEYMHVTPGFSYDDDCKCFYPPKPYDSFIKNTVNHMWDPPVEYPNDGKEYTWSEDKKNWIQLITNNK